ncbi:MAG: hypothetical protein JL50_10900 [Peptococcaceae bacterium BICA1-7]|nr:MAG: hypothetical protein JL50_10900 [Peptococcaceae bacterium BICA1-7]HBV95793.1 hypothetical protein [Desulfotomaculum sp.]
MKIRCENCGRIINHNKQWRYCPLCGKNLKYGKEITGEEAVIDAVSKYETLCLSCTRAYALPDPQGCAFFRKVGDDIEYTPFTDCIVFISKGYKQFKVTKCSDYKPERVQ